MKKRAVWVIALLLLLLSACGGETEETQPTDFQVACFGCEQEFASGQLNADFGLCQDCMIKAGAVYCPNCAEPCYIRDMIQGLCQNCSASLDDTTASPEKAEQTEAVKCEYCGYFVLSEYMIEGHCVGCYSIREGKCLRCTHNSHLPDGCHCEYCSENWFYCASCDKRTAGNEMFLDLCLDCYWRLNSVLVPCPLCGRSISPSEVEGGFCHACYAQENYEETTTYSCSSCGREFDTSDDLYDGKCWTCYYEDTELCVSCHTNPSEGYGPSAMECAQCYYESYATCPGCGYDYWKDDMIDGYCNSCSQVSLVGTYYAVYENVKITITQHEYAEYCLTYTDLSSGVTLRNIPLSYYSSNTSTSKCLMFCIDDSYPAYGGYVEFCLNIGARADYSYNALIDGLEDSAGSYSPLTQE